MEETIQEDETESRLELAADALLAEVEVSEEYPAYTELQLLRHGEGHLAPTANGENAILLAVTFSPQDLEEELLFLIRVTELKRVERCLLRGWLAGWTQEQIRRAFPTEAGRYSQQHISRLLREALAKCYSSGLSFRDFSHHTVYRKPMRRTGVTLRMMTCRGCQHEFVFGLGAGRFYCSKSCFEASQREDW